MRFGESFSNEQHAAYDSERADRGHRTEETVLDAMRELGYEELGRDSLDHDPGVGRGFVRANPTEDWKGIDVHIWNSEVGTWVKTDITVDMRARHQIWEESKQDVDAVLMVDSDYVDMLEKPGRDVRHRDALEILSDRMDIMFRRYQDKQRKKARGRI